MVIYALMAIVSPLKNRAGFCFGRFVAMNFQLRNYT